jgi:hypothetical protein
MAAQQRRWLTATKGYAGERNGRSALTSHCFNGVLTEMDAKHTISSALEVDA